MKKKKNYNTTEIAEGTITNIDQCIGADLVSTAISKIVKWCKNDKSPINQSRSGLY